MAIWFRNFSTWTGRHGIYLEDLYVRPEARGTGVGRALVAELAAVAHRAGYGRLDWSVLDWNESAIRFYRSLGAVPMDEWTGYRLSGEAWLRWPPLSIGELTGADRSVPTNPLALPQVIPHERRRSPRGPAGRCGGGVLRW